MAARTARGAWRSRRSSPHTTPPHRPSGRSSIRSPPRSAGWTRWSPSTALAEVGGAPGGGSRDVAELRRNTYQRFGEAAPTRTGWDRRRWTASPPSTDWPRSPTRTTGERCSMRWSPSGEPSTVTAVPRARIGHSSCDPAPRVGPATGPRWRPRRRPSALGPARSKPCCTRCSRRGAPSSTRGSSSRGTTATRRARWTGDWTGSSHAPASSDQRRPPAKPRRGSNGPRHRVRHRAAARAADDPDGIRDRRDIAREAADGTWRAATPWVFATHAEGGLGNLEELLHESGHALQCAAIRARPALFDSLVADVGLDEAFGDLLGWDVHEPHSRHGI